MARDDYDDRDDRPRRRRRDYDDAPKSGGGGKVVLIVLLAVGIPLLVCGGVAAWAMYSFVTAVKQVAASVKEGVEQVAGSLQATQEAEQFLNLLESAPNSAYRRTTQDFQDSMTKEEFEKLLADHPVLTTQNYHTDRNLPTPTGTAPNRTVTVTYTVIAGVNPNPSDDDETPNTGGTPTTKPAKPTTPSTAPKPKSVNVTITLVEQSEGSWKVDEFIVD